MGLLFDAKITFNLNINAVINKACIRAGLNFPFTKDFEDVYVLKLLYCAMVRPILKYCNCVWCEWIRTSIKRS